MITFSIFYNQYFLTWYFSKRGHFIQQFSVQFVNIARDPCTTNVYRDLQGLCWEIGVRRFQIYCDRVVRQWWISKTGNLPETCRKPVKTFFNFVFGRFPVNRQSVIDGPHGIPAIPVILKSPHSDFHVKAVGILTLQVYYGDTTY